MSYNPNIPALTDPMLKSQRQILANFQAINSYFAQNHAQLNSSMQGMHDLLLFLEQTADPTTDATQIALYTKAVAGTACAFFRPSSSQTPIQLTYPTIKVDSSNTQYTFCAGPFVIYGGLIPGCVSGQAVVLLPVTTLRFVGAVALHAGNQSSPLVYESVCATNIVTNTFNLFFSSQSVPLNVIYFAIGQ